MRPKAMEKPVRILLADDHQLLTEGIQALLSAYAPYRLVGLANESEEVLNLVRSLKVDLLILDINMPVKDGITVLGEVRKELPEVKVIMLSSYNDLKLIQESFRLGANGYLTKQSASDLLIEAIRTAMSGETFYDPSIQQKILTQFAHGSAAVPEDIERAMMMQISEREIEILRMIATQYTSEEIAGHLHIAKSTVDTHRKNLIRKLKVKNAVGLALFAQRNGII